MALPTQIPRMKTIGLIGGMSHESSAEYYRLVNQGMKERLGGHNNARSVMVTVCFDDIVRMQQEERWDDAGQLLAQAAGQVQAAGADFVLLCTNTMHEVAGAIEEALRIPFIHIVDPTAQALKAAGITRVGLLGTRFTMERPFYISRLHEKHGIEAMVPDAAGRDAVHALIYDELCHGVVSEPSREVVVRVISQLVERGAEGIILGCTELTLLVQPEHTTTPLFDTAGLHANAAVDLALSPDIPLVR